MHVVIGGGLLAGGLLIVVLLTALFARAQGRGWLDADLTALLLTFPPAVMMGVGAAFVLVNDHDPKPLYYQFNAEQAGQFTWEYLEQGPETWRVRVGKSAPAT